MTSRVVSVLSVAALTALGCAKKLSDASAERAVDPGALEKATRANQGGGAFDGPSLPDVASRVLPSVVSVASTRIARTETPDLPSPDDPFLRRFFGPEGVSIELLRGGTKTMAKATLVRQPADEPATQKPDTSSSDASAGLELVPLDATLREKLGAPTSLKGVVVTGVRPGSPAALADLEEGDVILEAGGQTVESPSVLANRWRGAKGALALVVWRKQRTFFAVLKR